MKKINVFLLACLFFTLSIGQTGCYGPFRLTKNLHEWNSTVGDKFTNALVFFAFVIIPVYPIAVLADGIVLNTIEFWSGDNPVAMKDGEKDVQIVQKDGKKYRITATKNKFHIEQIKGPDKGQFAELIFDPITKSWNLKDGDKELQKLVSFNEQAETIEIYKPNGDVILVNPYDYDLAELKKQINATPANWAMK
ncbi:DUF3332 domain-containing protein [Marinifilum caeruleilacunae]|uniref:DUF3332 domain-containing protein n=1 Tax=Marinifilum caeruleilacunae TaxID=2499076 RepID=A0ABX1WX65_9BACT|nr:DUF3332 domain-containing protein [Marinifilum caeruleilacunae]NOU60669.1 DUF3332 domain-containing protein [Marinifilum caeruleilacunae]